METRANRIMTRSRSRSPAVQARKVSPGKSGASLEKKTVSKEISKTASTKKSSQKTSPSKTKSSPITQSSTESRKSPRRVAEEFSMTPKKHGSSSFAQAYLALYNMASALAWVFVLAQTILAFYPVLLSAKVISVNSALSTLAKASHQVFLKCSFLLAVVQSAAVLDISHSILGLTQSRVLPTVVQVASRLLVGVLLTWKLKVGSEGHWGMLAICVAWSISDFTRSMYYVANMFKMAPRWLTWARYSFFLVLYPLGTAGEMGLIWRASVMNAFVGIQRYALLATLGIYPLGFVALYSHMLKQRASHAVFSVGTSPKGGPMTRRKTK